MQRASVNYYMQRMEGIIVLSQYQFFRIGKRIINLAHVQQIVSQKDASGIQFIEITLQTTSCFVHKDSEPEDYDILLKLIESQPDIMGE